MSEYNPCEIVLMVDGHLVERFAENDTIEVSEQHPAWKIFNSECLVEIKRINKITDPVKRESDFEHFKAWAEEETKVIHMLINNQESSVADAYEELKHV